MAISKSAFRAAMALAAGLKKKSGKTWGCCGLPIEIDHIKQGCNGKAENHGKPIDVGHDHSGEVFMTARQYQQFLDSGGKAKSARRADGGYYVHQK